VEFRQGSGLELPFDDGSFDVVWTEHVQMNIEDKETFYREMHRVLKTGGRLAFHDIFAGHGGDSYYPVPWAEDRSISFLWPPGRVRDTLAGIGFRIRDWADKTPHSQVWLAAVAEKMQASGPPPLGLHLLMGKTAPVKFQNQGRNLAEGRIAVIQAVAQKA
jgi:ubiquinone/menaquinone biosynthesis C-methylase UbiE